MSGGGLPWWTSLAAWNISRRCSEIPTSVVPGENNTHGPNKSCYLSSSIYSKRMEKVKVASFFQQISEKVALILKVYSSKCFWFVGMICQGTSLQNSRPVPPDPEKRTHFEPACVICGLIEVPKQSMGGSASNSFMWTSLHVRWDFVDSVPWKRFLRKWRSIQKIRTEDLK